MPDIAGLIAFISWNVEPKDRGGAIVFQNSALCPHKIVVDSMEIALKPQKVPRREIEARRWG